MRSPEIAERLQYIGLRPGFGSIYQPKGRRGIWVDCRPHATIYSDRGRGFKSVDHAQRVADSIVERVLAGESVQAVLAEYRPGLTQAIPLPQPQEDWKEEYKQRMLIGAKRRAKKKNIPFDLTPEDIRVPSVCPVLKIPLRPSVPGTGKNDNAPSLDRIIPGLGYVPGNVLIISWRANHLKRDATAEELKLVADWLAYVNELPPLAVSANSGLAQKEGA